MNRSRADKTRDTTRDKTRHTYERARDGVQSTYAQVQSNVKTGLHRTQALLAIIAGIIGALLERKAQRGQTRWKKTQQGTRHRHKNTHSIFSNGMERTQGTLSAGMTAAQKSFTRNARKAQKNLQQAQHNLRDMQTSLQENISAGIATGLARTQDLLQRSGERARKVAAYPREMQLARQERHEQRAHRRAQARTLFRWGLVTGAVLALIYAPVSGAETRRYLAEKWQQGRDYFKSPTTSI